MGAVHLQSAGGNWTTVGQKREEEGVSLGREGESLGLRVGTFHVGTMTGKRRVS